MQNIATQLTFVLALLPGLLALSEANNQTKPLVPTPKYSITDLGTLPGFDNAFPNAINNKSQIVGWVSKQTTGHPFLWENGKMRDMGALPNYPVTMATAINENGQVIGEAYTGEEGQPFYSTNKHGVFWEQGQPHELSCLPGYTFLNVLWLNNKGRIAGVCSANNQYYVFLHDRTKMTILFQGMSGGITDNEEVPGKANGGTFLWHDSKSSDLFLDEIVQIHNDGQVLGSVGSRYYLAEKGKPPHLLVAHTGPGTLNLFGFNDQEQAVGTVGGPHLRSHAVIIIQGKEINLETLLAANSGWHLYMAMGINDKGQIICQAYQDLPETGVSTLHWHALLLTPTTVQLH
jgi:probable HAF family extracellular repeat protein